MKEEERTPMTEEEKILEKHFGSDYWMLGDLTTKHIVNAMKENAQAKVLEALEKEDLNVYTGLRDLNGDRIYRGDVVQNVVEERGVIMYWDGAFCVAYFDEPAKEYLHTLTITDKNYCSTGKVKLTRITKQK